MNMTKISTLLTSIALASTPLFAQAYQIAPNPNPVDKYHRCAEQRCRNLQFH